MPEIVLDLDHLHEVVDRFLEFDAFAFDTETKGEYRLDPRRNQCFWMSLAGPGETVVIPFGHPIGSKQIGTRLEPKLCADGKTRNYKKPVWSAPPKQLTPAQVFGALKPLFFNEDIIKVGHNIKFDLETISKYFGEVPSGPYFDTLVAAFLVNENYHQYRLGTCVKREFDFEYDKTPGAEVESVPFKKAALYAHYDAKYTWMLYRRYLPQLEEEKVMGVFRLEMDVMPVLIDMENEGAFVDIDALRQLEADLDKEVQRLTIDLYRLVGREWNFNSHPQKVEVFYGKKKEGGQGLRPRKFTGGGAPSCDDDALEYHIGNPLVDAFREYGDVNKLLTTYVRAYLNEGAGKSKERNNAPPYNEETGCIHANFKQYGAVTGRFSCSEPNLQNIPRPESELGKRIRGLFIAPPGHTLIVADWSQIEYRVLAKFSNDQRLIKAFQDGVDFHQYVASMLLRKPMDDVTKVERTVSKNTNFATVYGAGDDKVAAMSGVTVENAKEFRAMHRKMLPKVYQFCGSVIRTCRSRRPPHVKTILGRKRRLPEINWGGDHNWGRRAYAERQAVNTVIQGSAADMMKLALVRLDALRDDDMAILLTVHDELVMKVPDDRVEAGMAVMKEAMMGDDIAALIAPVPLEADIKAVKRWSDAK